MAFVKPTYTRGEVNRAGEFMAGRAAAPAAGPDLLDVFTNWRAAHSYPINTFQATLRHRLKDINTKAIVAQRLKRAPSIIFKLQRFPHMQLSRMQDIGGLRAVVESISKVRKLEELYRKPRAFQHTLHSSKDYIAAPKSDGYRGVHLVFQYKNDAAPEYDKLFLEL